jgi:hypothetical protein
LQIAAQVFLDIADIISMDAIRSYFVKDSDEIILDMITTVLVGGAMISLAGLVFAPIFIPLAIAFLVIFSVIAVIG